MRQPLWVQATSPAGAGERAGAQPAEDDVLIEFRNVHKSFGSKPILRGASFKIRRGEAVGIIGSSGTGKSTTLRLAAGLLAPDKVRSPGCAACRARAPAVSCHRERL